MNFRSWLPKKTEDPRLTRAKEQRQQARRDHEEVIQLLGMLDNERELNHYAEVIEVALGTRRGEDRNG